MISPQSPDNFAITVSFMKKKKAFICSAAVLKLQHGLKFFIYDGTGVYKAG